jgi:hypothetical protein
MPKRTRDDERPADAIGTTGYGSEDREQDASGKTSLSGRDLLDVVSQ